MPKITVVSDGANWVLDDIKRDFTKFSSKQYHTIDARAKEFVDHLRRM